MDAVAQAPPSLQPPGRRRVIARCRGAWGGGDRRIGAPADGRIGGKEEERDLIIRGGDYVRVPGSYNGDPREHKDDDEARRWRRDGQGAGGNTLLQAVDLMRGDAECLMGRRRR
jgi:hypothetical protein